MGCITGMIAKTFLIAFNVVVALTGVGVLTTSAIVATRLGGYQDLVPKEPSQVLDGLEAVASLVMMFGIFGTVVSCCCSNKLFMYTYGILGIGLVAATLTFGGMALTGIDNEQYAHDIKKLMMEDMDQFNVTDQTGEYEVARNALYSEMECCGVVSYTDWKPKPFLPDGCCKSYSDTVNQPCVAENDAQNINTLGCYTKLAEDVGNLATATAQLAVFFGVLLFGLVMSTCVCVKCTDAMPI